jgi:hypothetical protein
MAAAPRILILASQSPRRLDLLASIGIVPDQAIAPNVDETPLPQEPPRALATRPGCWPPIPWLPLAGGLCRARPTPVPPAPA